VFHGFLVHFLAIHNERAGAAFAESAAVELEVEDNSSTVSPGSLELSFI
jgi:hypothetical protein